MTKPKCPHCDAEQHCKAIGDCSGWSCWCSECGDHFVCDIINGKYSTSAMGPFQTTPENYGYSNREVFKHVQREV